MMSNSTGQSITSNIKFAVYWFDFYSFMMKKLIKKFLWGGEFPSITTGHYNPDLSATTWLALK